MRFVRGHRGPSKKPRRRLLMPEEADRRARERRQKWRERNAEKVAAQGAARFRARRDDIVRRRRESGQAVMHAAARRARLAGAFVEDVHPLVVLEAFDGTCGICGEDVDPLNFEVDHIVPLALGGEHSYANTQPAHGECNRRKGAR